jgi:hypothetical protein
VEFSIVTLNIVHGGKAALTVESWHLDYVSVEAQFLAAQNSCRLNKLVDEVLQKFLTAASVGCHVALVQHVDIKAFEGGLTPSMALPILAQLA